MKHYKILIVEDDEKIACVLKEYLEEVHFNILISNTGKGVVEYVRASPPDLIILDIRLPDKDGMTICNEIRSFSNVPIIFLSAKVGDIDRVLGLESGADDYICKPFVPAEVVARVKAVLRRFKSQQIQDKLVVEPLVIDLKTHIVTVDESVLYLTPIEYNLLRTMMSSPGEVFTRLDLLYKIQGYDTEGYERTIDNHIKNLRKKIYLHLPDVEVIHTVFGFGYKIDPPNIV
jgi:two-component system, OmpR family, response regulator BaeR